LANPDTIQTNNAVLTDLPPVQIEGKPGERTGTQVGAAGNQSTATGPVEVSFVMPCLNEAETLKGCIDACWKCIRENNLSAEIVIGDNGSTDGSQQIAISNGARVAHATAKGYGNALMAGFAAARGKYIIMGDSDQSYDFSEGMRFITKLREGYDLVMGTRFGEGKIDPGAMPFKHRWLGNPVLSWIGRLLFGCPVRDFHCGLRAFSKAAYERWDLRTTGMEFASELAIKATLKNSRITEVPITLHKDGRSRPPHLRSWRDGWRHLRFMMMLSPRWTLFFPGVALVMLGLVLGGLTLFGTTVIAGVSLDVHTLLAASLFLVVGYMWITTAAAMRIFSLTSEIGPPGPRVEKMFKHFTLERGLIAGIATTIGGVATIGWLVWVWAQKDFGPLDLHTTIRPMITGATLIAIGVQTVLMSVIYSMMGIRHKAAAGAGAGATK